MGARPRARFLVDRFLLVRVYTDEGIVGTGECNSAAASASGFATKEAILHLKDHLAIFDRLYFRSTDTLI